jgi:hypothetical protein
VQVLVLHSLSLRDKGRGKGYPAAFPASATYWRAEPDPVSPTGSQCSPSCFQSACPLGTPGTRVPTLGCRMHVTWLGKRPKWTASKLVQKGYAPPDAANGSMGMRSRKR